MTRLGLILVLWMTLLGAAAPLSAQDRLQIGPDQIGESLKHFHRFHKDALCTRRPIEEFSAERFRATESSWIDCNIRTTTVPAGQKLLIEADPTRPFGVFASFYKRRLIEFSYTLAATPLEPLVQTLQRQYGQPSRATRDNTGQLDSVTWLSRAVRLDVSVVSIPAAAADAHFLRLGAGRQGKGIRMRFWRKPQHNLQTEDDSR